MFDNESMAKLSLVKTALKLMGYDIVFIPDVSLPYDDQRGFLVTTQNGVIFHANSEWYSKSSYEHILNRVMQEIRR